MSRRAQQFSGVDSEGARVPPEFGGSYKGRSLISAYQSLAITASTSGAALVSLSIIDLSLPYSADICLHF